VIHYLRTQQQYDNAPTWTVVEASPYGFSFGATYVKTPHGWAGGMVPRLPMVLARRRILRWGAP
jgi:hypothetical protein